MTITLLAPDGVAVTAQQERQARAAMYAGSPSRPLGGRSGFRIGTPSTILTATSTTWTLQPFAAMIDPGFATHQGMYGWSSDAVITGAVTAANGTNPRKDLVYLQVNDSSAGDGSGAINANIGYIAGTPGPTPSAPALPARSFEIGIISVPTSGGGSPTVSLNSARFVAAGGIQPVTGTTERDALDKYDGLTVRRLDLVRRPLEVWDGAGWFQSDYSEASQAISTFGTGWGATSGHTPTVHREGNRVHLVGAVTLSSGGQYSNILTIPVGFRPLSTATTFIGTNVTSGGAVIQLASSTNLIVSPNTYRLGSMANGDVLPLVATWTID